MVACGSILSMEVFASLCHRWHDLEADLVYGVWLAASRSLEAKILSCTRGAQRPPSWGNECNCFQEGL